MTATFVMSRYHEHGDWRPIEERLPCEAESLGDLLGRLTGFVSPALLDASGWQPVLAAAGRWPVTCGALPFGFEFQLRDPRPQADFGITLVSRGRTADWIRREAHDARAPAVIGRLATLLDAMGTALQREVGRAMLEVDIASSSSPASRKPGVFLYFRDRTPEPPSDGRRKVEAVLAALNAAAVRPDDPDELRLAEEVSRAVPPGASFVSLGAVPGRSRGFRLTVSGFAEGAGAVAFLRSVGWNGRYDVLADTIARLAERRAFSRLGLMLYGRREGLETTLGLYLQRRPRTMPALLDALAGEGCVEGKLSGLRATATSPVVLWGRTGEFTLMRGITHVKLVLSDTGFGDMKAYMGLICA